jgi:trehalose-phosphatase
LERVDEWRSARRRAGRLLVAIDFDGTLAPIAPSPDEVVLPDDARMALVRLAERHDTDLAIVSGRALEDLRPRIGLPGLYYAGNHGLEIEGPGVQEIHREAALARPEIMACADRVRQALETEVGAFVEDKGLTLSIHYRRVPDSAAEERVQRVVYDCCAESPGLHLTRGKKVLEVRPAVEWDKGRATRFLLEVLDANFITTHSALFIGDDRTDEDAFEAIRDRGGGVVVAPTPPRHTAAIAYLRSTDEVALFLNALAAPD